MLRKLLRRRSAVQGANSGYEVFVRAVQGDRFFDRQVGYPQKQDGSAHHRRVWKGFWIIDKSCREQRLSLIPWLVPWPNCSHAKECFSTDVHVPCTRVVAVKTVDGWEPVLNVATGQYAAGAKWISLPDSTAELKVRQCDAQACSGPGASPTVENCCLLFWCHRLSRPDNSSSALTTPRTILRIRSNRRVCASS